MLNKFINDWVNIENSIKYINDINEKIKKYNCMNINVKFVTEESKFNEIINLVKNIGKLNYNNFKFKICPKNINENRKYIVSGEENNIITKTGTDKVWMYTICENILNKQKKYKWKVKILKTLNHEIKIGVAPLDFDINSSSIENCILHFYGITICFMIMIVDKLPLNGLHKILIIQLLQII